MNRSVLFFSLFIVKYYSKERKTTSLNKKKSVVVGERFLPDWYHVKELANISDDFDN